MRRVITRLILVMRPLYVKIVGELLSQKAQEVSTEIIAPTVCTAFIWISNRVIDHLIVAVIWNL